MTWRGARSETSGAALTSFASPLHFNEEDVRDRYEASCSSTVDVVKT